jgi:hypothetical protein
MVKSKMLMLIKKVKTDMTDTDMDMNAKKLRSVLTGHHLRLARIKAHEPMTTEPKKRRSATCLVSIELRSLTDPSRDRKGLQVKNAFTTLTAHRSLDGLVADGGRRINRVLGQARAPGWKYHTRRVGPVAEAVGKQRSRIGESPRGLSSLKRAAPALLQPVYAARGDGRRREREKRTCGWAGSGRSSKQRYCLTCGFLGNRSNRNGRQKPRAGVLGRTAQRQKGGRVGDVPASARQNAGLYCTTWSTQKNTRVGRKRVDCCSLETPFWQSLA